MPATALAIIASTSAANSAAIAAQEAARRAQCVLDVRGYQNDGASVEAARHYAGCVYTLYGSGEALDPFAALLIKALIVLTAAGLIWGAVKGWRDDRTFGMAVASAVIGMILLPFSVAIVAGLAVGLWWVVT